MIRFRLNILGQEYFIGDDVPPLNASHREAVASICPITGEVKFDHLVKVVSAIFLYSKSSCFLL